MLVCLRPLLAAGTIVVVVFFARGCSVFIARSASSPAPARALAASSSATVAEQPAILASAAHPVEETACAALLREGRFAELLTRAAALDDDEARTRWLAACGRLALPRLLAEHALRMPAGAEREALLEVAMERWALDAPADLGEWAAAHPDDRIVDGALAHIVEHTDALERPAATALAWTQLIHDPALRFRALRAVVREWAERDPDAALRFAETAPDLASEQRATLLALLLPPVSET